MPVKKWFGLALLLTLVACNAPKNAQGDHTLNKSRVSRSHVASSGSGSGSKRKESGGGKESFLDAVETKGGKSSSDHLEARRSESSSADRAASKSSAASRTADIIVFESEKLLGVKYRYAGDSPSRGFDCSGFTSYLFGKARINLPRTSTEQSRIGKRKKFDQAEVGDLVFFGTGSRVTHVAVVVARTRDSMQIVHSTSSNGVRYDEVFSSRYWNSRKLWAVDLDSLTQ